MRAVNVAVDRMNADRSGAEDTKRHFDWLD